MAPLIELSEDTSSDSSSTPSLSLSSTTDIPFQSPTVYPSMVNSTKYPNLNHYYFTLLPHFFQNIIPISYLPQTKSEMSRDVTYAPTKCQTNRISVPKPRVYSRSDSKQGSRRRPKWSDIYAIIHFVTPSKLHLHQQISSFFALTRIIHPTPSSYRTKTKIFFTNHNLHHNHITSFIWHKYHHTCAHLPHSKMTRANYRYFPFK